jgi:threonine dehydrogenase-like Zn-dependent dehydrogenase
MKEDTRRKADQNMAKHGKMKAVIYEGNGVMKIRQVDIPQIIEPDDLILMVEACSVCGVDVHILYGTYSANTGIALGHEIVAMVSEVGPQVSKFKPGDRVIVKPNIYCGKCEYCLRDMTNHCENIVTIGIHIHGGFSEYFKAKEKVCYKISQDLPTNIAIFAEPLACVLGALKKIKPMPGESATIFGAGPIALIFLKVLKAMNVKPIIMSELNENRKCLAKEFGADYVVNPTIESVEDYVRKIVPMGTDFAIDVVGSQMKTACSVVRKRGKVLLFGVNLQAEPSITQSMITLNEINILGTYVDDATFPLAVDVLEKRLIDLEPLITHTLSLDELADGFELLKQGKALEIVVTPNEDDCPNWRS